MKIKHTAPICFFAVVAAAFSADPAYAQRQTVLKQIDVPHNYYYREMYLPQLTSGPSALRSHPTGRRSSIRCRVACGSSKSTRPPRNSLQPGLGTTTNRIGRRTAGTSLSCVTSMTRWKLTASM